MVYAGDQWVLLPVRDLYDTLMMAMAINAARDMYERGEKRLDDFYTKYGDFTSPILKDMDAYNNIIGGVRDKINELYAMGVDPLRSAEGRAAVALLTRNIPVGDIAKLRQSAETAKEFVKNRGLLERAGKYNKDLNERYLGYNLDTFDTLGGGNVWGISSPMEIESLKELTEKSFNNRTPHDLTKDEVLSFEGQTYDPRMKYKGFTMRDLQDIANTVAPGLYGDPRYDYYRDLARQKVIAEGKEPTEKAINEQLSNDIANSQVEYLVRPQGDMSDYWNRVKIGLQAESNRLARDKFNWEKLKAAAAQNTDDPGISLASTWFAKGAANAWSADGTTKNWYEMKSAQYGQFGRDAGKIFMDFGKLQKGKSLGDAMNAFEKKFSIKMDEEAVASIIGSPVDGNKKVAMASDAAIDKLYGVYDIVSNTAGFTKQHKNSTTKSIRDAIKRYGASNTTITPLGTGYASLRKAGGNFNVMPKVRVTITDGDKVVYQKDAYYDIDLSSATTSGGAYVKDYTENPTGGFVQIGTPGVSYDRETGMFTPKQVSFNYTGPVNYNTKEYNLYPDYNQWNGYGVWDTRETSKQLKAKASEELGTY